MNVPLRPYFIKARSEKGSPDVGSVRSIAIWQRQLTFVQVVILLPAQTSHPVIMPLAQFYYN